MRDQHSKGKTPAAHEHPITNTLILRPSMRLFLHQNLSSRLVLLADRHGVLRRPVSDRLHCHGHGTRAKVRFGTDGIGGGEAVATRVRPLEHSHTARFCCRSAGIDGENRTRATYT